MRLGQGRPARKPHPPGPRRRQGGATRPQLWQRSAARRGAARASGLAAEAYRAATGEAAPPGRVSVMRMRGRAPFWWPDTEVIPY